MKFKIKNKNEDLFLENEKKDLIKLIIKNNNENIAKFLLKNNNFILSKEKRILKWKRIIGKIFKIKYLSLGKQENMRISYKDKLHNINIIYEIVRGIKFLS